MYQRHMKSAITVARKHDSIYGAVLAMGDQQVVAVSDAATQEYDTTGHAVIVALRELGALTREVHFRGYELYTTIEPCPLCATGCVIAGVQKVYFGLSREQVEDTRYPGGPNAADIFKQADHPPEMEKGFLKEQCQNLL